MVGDEVDGDGDGDGDCRARNGRVGWADGGINTVLRSEDTFVCGR